ncbi:acyl-ACP--UDP-N-acetylglucosamine O-acyltransferase [Bradyrhizobium sp. LM3.2]
MSKIDPTARVEDGAVIGEGTEIGPYCIIGANVVIGANCKLIGHVHITAQTTIGDDCTIYPFASLGTPPQSLSYRGELTKLKIGSGCTIRESVTMNAGTVTGGGITEVGDRNYFHELQPCRPRLPCRQRRDLRHLGDARRSLRDW